MAPTLESLGIDKLSREDQLAIAQTIWDRLLLDDSDSIDDELDAELDRRIAEDEAGQGGNATWEEVKRLGRIRAGL